MRLPWFKRSGAVFLPITAIGWIISLVAFASCIYLFISIDSRSHSVSDTLMNFAFNVAIVAAIYTTIAFAARPWRG